MRMLRHTHTHTHTHIDLALESGKHTHSNTHKRYKGLNFYFARYKCS